jgi:hypothetical protein
MQRTLAAFHVTVFAAVSVVSTMAASAPVRAEYAKVLIAGVPHVRQKPDFCGEACAEMWLAKLGRKWTQDQVFNASGLDPALARGCYALVSFRDGQVGRVDRGQVQDASRRPRRGRALHRLHAL